MTYLLIDLAQVGPELGQAFVSALQLVQLHLLGLQILAELQDLM